MHVLSKFGAYRDVGTSLRLTVYLSEDLNKMKKTGLLSHSYLPLKKVESQHNSVESVTLPQLDGLRPITEGLYEIDKVCYKSSIQFLKDNGKINDDQYSSLINSPLVTNEKPSFFLFKRFFREGTPVISLFVTADLAPVTTPWFDEVDYLDQKFIDLTTNKFSLRGLRGANLGLSLYPNFLLMDMFERDITSADATTLLKKVANVVGFVKSKNFKNYLSVLKARFTPDISLIDDVSKLWSSLWNNPRPAVDKLGTYAAIYDALGDRVSNIQLGDVKVTEGSLVHCIYLASGGKLFSNVSDVRAGMEQRNGRVKITITGQRGSLTCYSFVNNLYTGDLDTDFLRFCVTVDLLKVHCSYFLDCTEVNHVEPPDIDRQIIPPTLVYKAAGAYFASKGGVTNDTTETST